MSYKHCIEEIIKKRLGDDIVIDWDLPLNEQGVSSMIILMIKRDIEKNKKIKIKTDLLFKYPTLNLFCDYLENEFKSETPAKE